MEEGVAIAFGDEVDGETIVAEATAATNTMEVGFGILITTASKKRLWY